MLGPGGFRFLLAWMVVVEHVSRFEIGKVAVMAFFTLSGYWVTRVFVERYSHARQGVWVFYLARFLRIWPLYATIFLIVLFLWLIMPLQLPPDFWVALPILGVASHGIDIIGVTWSLDVELQFYLLLPVIVLLRGFPSSPNKAIIVLGGALIWACGLFLGWRYEFETALRYLPLFLAGAAIFLFDLNVGRTAARISVTAFILAGGGATLVPALTPFVIYGSGSDLADKTFALFWGLLLIPFIMFNVRQPSGRMDRHLGNLSYVIYLVHYPTGEVANEVLGRSMSDPEKLVYFVVVLLLSLSLYVLFDMRYEKWRRNISTGLQRNNLFKGSER